MKNVILTDPAHDEPTKSLSYWIADVVAHISHITDVKAIHLKGTDASPDMFSRSVEKHDPSLILLSGHGNHLCVCGHNDVPLVHSEHDSTLLLEKRIVHALACKAGQKLGKELIDLGTVAFIGYKEDFQFLHLSEDGSDPVATLFLEPAYNVAKSLASGETAEKAHKDSQRMYANSLRLALAAGSGSSNVAASLLHDIKHHVLIGDPQATI